MAMQDGAILGRILSAAKASNNTIIETFKSAFEQFQNQRLGQCNALVNTCRTESNNWWDVGNERPGAQLVIAQMDNRRSQKQEDGTTKPNKL